MVVRSSTGNSDNEVITLFKSPLWALWEELPKGAYEWALDYKKKNPSDIQVSNRGGYQSKNNVIVYKNTSSGRSSVIDSSGKPRLFLELESANGFPYYQHIRNSLNKIKGMENFIMTDWWLNINEKGDHNLPHVHPGSDLALIWYITHNEGLLNFQEPDLMTRNKLYERGLLEDSNKSMHCPAGSIIVFPSDIIHRVDEHMLDTPRISVSSNLIAKY